MTRRQLNQLAMGQAVVGYLDQNATFLASYPATVPITDSIRQTVNELVGLSQKQKENNTPGFTRNKNMELEKLQDGTALLSAQLRAFSKLNGDQVMLESVRHTKWNLDNFTIHSLLETSQIVIGHARTNLGALASFGVTEEGIASLEISHAEVNKLINLRDVAGGTRKAATDTIPELLTKMRDLLELMDDMVDSLIHDVEWQNVYYNLRKIIDRGGRSTPAEEQN